MHTVLSMNGLMLKEDHNESSANGRCAVDPRPADSCRHVVALIAEGTTTAEILARYPDLEADDIREALMFAAEAVRERALPLAAGE